MVVLFDLDDTLIDHRSAMRTATVALYEMVTVPASLETFVESWHEAHRRYYPKYLAGEMPYTMTVRARIRETIDEGMGDEEADRLFRDYLATYEAGWSLFPDVLPCLERFGSTRLGIISNGRSEEQRKKLAVTGIAHRFDSIVISEDCGYPKPRAEIFHRACEAMNVSPAAAAYVGDQYELDACAARAAGLEGIWLDRIAKASATHQGPIIASLHDLDATLTG
jgi:putative hydrolase of the HAD superfamily